MEPGLFNRKNIINIAIGIILVMICYYILFHVINGQRGITALFELSKELETKQGELDTLKKERIELEKKVKSMRSDSLDIDLLDEQARNNMGLVDPGEAVYFIDDKNKENSKK